MAVSVIGALLFAGEPNVPGMAATRGGGWRAVSWMFGLAAPERTEPYDEGRTAVSLGICSTPCTSQ
jgi:hypothetical protein